MFSSSNRLLSPLTVLAVSSCLTIFQAGAQTKENTTTTVTTTTVVTTKAKDSADKVKASNKATAKKAVNRDRLVAKPSTKTKQLKNAKATQPKNAQMQAKAQKTVQKAVQKTEQKPNSNQTQQGVLQQQSSEAMSVKTAPADAGVAAQTTTSNQSATVSNSNSARVQTRLVRRNYSIARPAMSPFPKAGQTQLELGYRRQDSQTFKSSLEGFDVANQRSESDAARLAARIGIANVMYLGIETQYGSRLSRSELDLMNSNTNSLVHGQGMADPHLLAGAVADFSRMALQFDIDATLSFGSSRLEQSELQSSGSQVEERSTSDFKTGGSSVDMQLSLYNTNVATARTGAILGANFVGTSEVQEQSLSGAVQTVRSGADTQTRIGGFIEFPRAANLGLLGAYKMAYNSWVQEGQTNERVYFKQNPSAELKAYLNWKINRTLELSPVLLAGYQIEGESRSGELQRGNYYGADLNLRLSF